MLPSLKHKTMRDNRRDLNYGEYNRNYNHYNQDDQFDGPYQGQRHADLGDTRREQGEYYRMQQSNEYGERGGNQGTKEDYYRSTYDISNYDGIPRSYDYGLPNGPVDELNNIQQYPLSEGPFAHREHYRYSQGYNANYDNPEKFSRMINLALEHNFKDASKLLFDFVDLNPLMYEEGNPVGIKAVLERFGVCSPAVRLPLEEASAGLKDRIYKLL
jgi:hypothetical protein